MCYASKRQQCIAISSTGSMASRFTDMDFSPAIPKEVRRGGFCDAQRQRGERAGVDLDVVVSDVDKKGEWLTPHAADHFLY